MTFPLDRGTYSIGRNFQAHKNDPTSAKNPGQDYPAKEDTIVRAPESGNAYMRIDSAGAYYVMVYGKTGIWFLVHLHHFQGNDRHVNEGDIIGYVGHTGHAFGDHLHLGLMVNGNYVDPIPYINRITNNNSYSNNTMNGYDTLVYGPDNYTVQPKDSFSRIIQKLGMPDTEHNWLFLAQLNGMTLDSIIHPGDMLKTGLNAAPVIPAPIVNNDADILRLKDQINQLVKDGQAAENELKQSYEAKINYLVIIQDQKQKELDDVEKQLKDYHAAMNVNLGILTPVLTDVINETITGSGILTKWNNWIDKHFKSNTLKSILKYDIFVLVGAVLSLPTLGVWLINSGVSLRISTYLHILIPTVSETGVTATIVGISGILFKLLLTRYDTNKDGVLNLSDTEVIKNYKS